MEQHYQSIYTKIMYPKIYGHEYEEPVQTSLFDRDELDSDQSTVDASNEEGRTRGQFKPGNKYRYQASEPEEEENTQLSLDVENT